MKTVTFFKRSLFLFLGISVMTLMACDKDEKTPVDDDDNDIITDWVFEMEVDGEKWEAKVATYTSYLHEREVNDDEAAYPNEDVYPLALTAYKLSPEKEDANQEGISITFSIPASKIKNATGTYDIGAIPISDNVTYISGSVNYLKGKKNYRAHYDTEPMVGTITLTKAVFGEQGIVNEIPLGEGLNEIEGSFEFELFEKDMNGDNKIKIKKGKFKLKTGVMQ